jgi:hypothetical protein
MLERKHIWIVGLITLGVLIYINSNKKLEMVEVQEVAPDEKKSFDSTTLPLILMPPTRLAEGEPLPETTIKKNFSSILNMSARLDTKPNNFL